MKWYVLRAVSGKEIKVKEYIDAAKKHNDVLGSHVGEVLLPTEKYAMPATRPQQGPTPAPCCPWELLGVGTGMGRATSGSRPRAQLAGSGDAREG